MFHFGVFNAMQSSCFDTVGGLFLQVYMTYTLFIDHEVR